MTFARSISELQEAIGRPDAGTLARFSDYVAELLERTPSFGTPAHDMLFAVVVTRLVRRRQDLDPTWPAELAARLSGALCSTEGPVTASVREVIAGFRRGTGNCQGWLALAARRLEPVVVRPTCRAADISRAMRVPIAELRRRLRDTECRTIPGLIRAVRIKKALVMLSRSDLSVKEVAAAVGYQGTAQFDRHFRQVMRLSPTMYRTQHAQPRSAVQLTPEVMRP